ncbi:MAG: hypothetical protein GYA50_07765 [Eubacteriaceae bacterium]|nr:hypothetical protein [Eubacteriaceae bacterium]
MKIIFGTILLLIFILTVGGIAFTYVFSVNNNINNMLKKKGFKNYKNYKKCVENKPIASSTPEDRNTKQDKYNNRYNYKIHKREEKRQVEEYLYYEMSKRRK